SGAKSSGRKRGTYAVRAQGGSLYSGADRAPNKTGKAQPPKESRLDPARLYRAGRSVWRFVPCCADGNSNIGLAVRASEPIDRPLLARERLASEQTLQSPLSEHRWRLDRPPSLSAETNDVRFRAIAD